MTRRAWLLFVLVGLVWGMPYLFIKLAVQELSPVAIVFVRLVIATVVVAPLTLRRGRPRLLLQRWPWILVVAVTEIAGPFLLIAIGEERIPSSLAGLLVAVEPVFIALLAIRAAASERVGGVRLAGIGVGLLGVVVLLGLDVGRDAPAALMVVAATFLYAVGALAIRVRLADVSPLDITTGSLLVATVLVGPLLPLGLPHRLPDATVVAALVVLGVVCTALGLVAFYALIAAAGAGRASLITYVNPAVAVVLGIVFLGEPFRPATGLGFALILLGSVAAGGAIGPVLRVRVRGTG